MLRPYNLLCLDEPTNHMDILSKDILKQALKAYDGTLVVVSHDRDFLDGLVDKVYEFRDGQVKEFLGGVSDFLEKRRLDSLNELERKQQDAPLPTAKEESAGAGQYRQNKFISKEEKKLRNRISYLEKKIDEVQARMKEIETVLANPSPSDDYMELTREFLERKRDLDAMTDEWAELSESLEQ